MAHLHVGFLACQEVSKLQKMVLRLKPENVVLVLIFKKPEKIWLVWFN